MNLSRHCAVWALVLLFTFSTTTLGIEWDPAKRVPIRENILSCHTYLALAEPTVNDSVGVQLSTNRIDDFEKQMAVAIEERGRDSLKKSHLFITGVAMGEEKQTVRNFETSLAKLGFEPGDIKVRVLSVPARLVKKISQGAFRKIYERLTYFFPSIQRDYQSPMLGEVVSGLASTAVIEVPNIVYLYKELPVTDATVTVSVHVVTLTVYTIYKKFMINWLLRPGTSTIENFIKQISLSFPFVANYAIFGKLSQIVAFYQNNGWQETLARFPAEMANFAATQGLTLFLQTLFYNVVVTNGVRGWENGQVGTERTNTARTVANWITVPILALDSVFLAMAASNGSPLFELGPMDVNAGHASLALTTLVGSALWVWPQILDPVLDWYVSIKGFVSRFIPFMKSAAAEQTKQLLDETKE